MCIHSDGGREREGEGGREGGREGGAQRIYYGKVKLLF